MKCPKCGHVISDEFVCAALLTALKQPRYAAQLFQALKPDLEKMAREMAIKALAERANIEVKKIES
jgi:hypothetical protein